MTCSRHDTIVRTGSVVVAVAAVGIAWSHHHRSRKQHHHSIPPSLLSSRYASELKLAVNMALRAGANMVRHCDTKGTELEQDDLDISFKNDKPEDFCTAVDWENERFMTSAIQQQFPSHIVIGEETTGTGDIPPLTTQPTWIMDPIDGTTNFASGLPLTCVSIAFCDHGRPVLGVVYAPMTLELYMAVEGQGAYRNAVRLVTKSSRKKSLRHAICNIEFGYGRSTEDVAKMVGAVQNVLNHGCRAIRCLGSGVLDLCYVATGRLDVVYAGVANEGWKPWDYAAGLVISTEAGCVMEALHGADGQEFDIYAKSVICATHKELLNECRQVVCQGLSTTTDTHNQ